MNDESQRRVADIVNNRGSLNGTTNNLSATAACRTGSGDLGQALMLVSLEILDRGSADQLMQVFRRFRLTVRARL